MLTRVTTTITTTIDLDTFETDHQVSIDSQDGLPIELIKAAVTGGCNATLGSLDDAVITVKA